MTDDRASGGPEPGPAELVLAGRRVPMLDRSRIYACGITPYDVTHLGHAATFVWVDALGRVLRLLGVDPEVCRNVTDVDDVLDAAASRARAPYDAFAAIQQYHFEHDLAALNVRPPRHEPRAHRYIEHVIRLAQGLTEVGRAYERKGSVYFGGQVAAAQAGLDRAEALRLSAEYGGRADDPAKDDPLDAAVWQAAEAGHPAWDSPWGPGGRGGTRNAWPWRCRRSASGWTCMRAGAISASRITPTIRPWPRRSPGSVLTRARGCTSAW